jgi:hypothetical protein
MLIELSAEGLEDEAIIARITEGAGPVLPRLREAGLSKGVIKAWLEPPPSTEAPPEVKPVRLPITMRYTSAKNSFELINMGDSDLTGLTVMLNGEFKYRLPVPLRPNKPDSIKLASARSIKTGDRMHDPGAPPFIKAKVVTKIVVRCDQGSWQKSF